MASLKMTDKESLTAPSGTRSEISSHSEDILNKEVPRATEDDTLNLPAIRQVPHWIKWVFAFLTLVMGLISTYAYKVMNREQVAPCYGCKPRYFAGSMIQCFFMFVGESLNYLVAYPIDLIISKKQNKYPFFEFIVKHGQLEGRRRGKAWWWLLPPFMDLIATAMMAIAMQITYASTVQMLRNFLVVGTAILQLLVVHKALRVHEYVGVLLITLALVLSAIPAVTNPEKSTDDSSKAPLGIALALVGTTIQAGQIIVEEFLMRKGHISPAKAMGLQGLYGIVYTLIAMPIMDKSGAEKVWQSWYQLGHSPLIITWTCVYVFIAASFNIAGLSTTRLAGGLLRSVIYALRAPIAWIIDLILKWIVYDAYNLASVLVFVVGFAIHCRMFELPGKVGVFYRKPVHCCCTNPELDDEYVDPKRKEVKNKETSPYPTAHEEEAV